MPQFTDINQRAKPEEEEYEEEEEEEEEYEEKAKAKVAPDSVIRIADRSNELVGRWTDVDGAGQLQLASRKAESGLASVCGEKFVKVVTASQGGAGWA